MEPEGCKTSHATSWGRVFWAQGKCMQRLEDEKKLCVLGKLKGASMGDGSEDERNGCLQDIRHILEEKSTEPGTVFVKVGEDKGGIYHDSLVMLSCTSKYFIIQIDQDCSICYTQ